MKFLVFDVSATLVFLLGYLTVANLRRRRVPVVARPAVRPAVRRAAARGWPRLASPR